MRTTTSSRAGTEDVDRQSRRIPNVLSIAGSDPSGGAGIQADLKTFAALGCHGMAVITALTAQNTREVSAIHLPPASFVSQQIVSVFADIDVAAVKIGMLGSREIVQAVAAALQPHHGVPIVLDPVLVATSGSSLGGEDVVRALRDNLIPFMTLVTPNLAEAARLAETRPLENDAAVEGAARTLCATQGPAWLIKGGHRDTPASNDYLLASHEAKWFSSPRVATRNTHGTGCTLSSAIAVFLAKGHTLRDAISLAKSYIDAALTGADQLQVGSGPGPVDHFVRWR